MIKPGLFFCVCLLMYTQELMPPCASRPLLLRLMAGFYVANHPSFLAFFILIVFFFFKKKKTISVFIHYPFSYLLYSLRKDIYFVVVEFVSGFQPQWFE